MTIYHDENMEKVIEMLEQEKITNYPEAYGFLADNDIEDPDAIREYFRRIENGSIDLD